MKSVLNKYYNVIGRGGNSKIARNSSVTRRKTQVLILIFGKMDKDKTIIVKETMGLIFGYFEWKM